MRRLGIVGLAEGKSILHAASRAERWKTHMVCDLNESVAIKLAQEYGVGKWTTDYKNMLAETDIDVIAIFTPDELHVQHCIMAFEANKDVLCTKPLALSVSECLRLDETRRRTGRALMVGQTCRFFPTFQALDRDVRAGSLGEIVSVEASYNGDKRQGPSGACARQAGVDWLWRGMIHPIDLISRYLTDIDTVWMQASSSPSASAKDSLDIFQIGLHDRSGALGLATGCFGAPESHSDAESLIQCTVRSSVGVVQARYPEFNYYSRLDHDGMQCRSYSNRHTEFFPWGGHAYHAGEMAVALDSFGNALDGNQPVEPDLNDALYVTKIIEKSRESYINKSVIPMD